MTYSDPQKDLKLSGLRAKKSWGQNFLKSTTVLETIAKTVCADPSGRILEIGAGLGHLTQALLDQNARVIAMERDRDLVAYLRKCFSDNTNVEIQEANALRFSYRDFANKEEFPPAVVGNLPYHITSPILFCLLEVLPSFSRTVLMVQREVGERILSSPSKKTYSALSVLVQARAKASRVCKVSRGCFYPIPKVDSVVILLEAVPDVDEQEWNGLFRKTVNAAFHTRRKTLKNSLQAEFPSCENALKVCQIDPRRRAETLRVEEFWQLARALDKTEEG